ncbi:MAG: type II toxin-antitoxin system RelE/ParE family toxin [Deltaproteobacteria bacterium]|nr:MAG: type II toxin-antitoxin system RelE/ParE family toxin [Deltaproteobacteria bacterium]
MYEIKLSESVEKDLKRIKAYDRNIILDAVEERLSHIPNIETKNRKMLVNLIPSFEAVPPIWELRVGEYRVFYDIDEEEQNIYVRAIRKKPPHKTTKEIL